jgi:hypothetical protein
MLGFSDPIKVGFRKLDIEGERYGDAQYLVCRYGGLVDGRTHVRIVRQPGRINIPFFDAIIM